MSEAIPLQALEGKYEILEKMSEGGMGAVYKVCHRLLNEVRVIKVMRPHIAEDELLRARFVREAKIAIRLRHPNIAQIYDFTMGEDGAFYLVMEFIDGMDLHYLTKTVSAVPISVALEIAHQSLSVIGYLHRKDIIHRDISPDNLLISRDDEGQLLVKLIDLGIAKVQAADEHLTATGTFLGKIRYSAPEQFRAEDGVEVGPRSDLYSFGIVMYETLTGAYPIKGSNLSSLITGHLMKAPKSFDETDPGGRVPEELRTIVLRALEKDPDKRHSDSRIFRTQIAKVREEYPVTEEDIHRIFEVPTLPTTKIPVMKPGSTQSHLDRNFGVETTPAHIAPTVVEANGEHVGGRHTVATEPISQAKEPGATAAVDQQVRALLLGAEKLVEGNHGDEARLQLEAAKTLAPDHPEVAKLERMLKAVDTRLKARREAAAAEILTLIEDENFDRAADRLDAAVNQLGRDPSLTELEETLAEAREARQDRQEHVAAIIEAARELITAEGWEDAAPMAREALMLEPGHEEAATILGEAEAGLVRHQEAQRRIAEIEKTVGAIRVHIENERPGEAARALSLSRKLYGDDAVFDDVEQTIAELRELLRRRQVDALREEGEGLLRDRVFGTAIDRFEKALSIAPDNQGLADNLAAAREGLRLQQEAEQRQQAIDDASLSVERLVLAGRLESAYRAIDGAVSDIGEFELAQALKARVGKNLADREAAEKSIRDRIDQVRSSAAANDFKAASKHVATAEKMIADYPEFGPQVEDLAREIREGAQAHRRAQDIEGAAKSISARLQAGSLERAERELGLAIRLYGNDESLLDLKDRLDAAMLRKEVERLVAIAEDPETDIDDAIRRLEEALGLDPGNQKVEDLRSGMVESRVRQDEEQRGFAINEALGPIDDLIAAGAIEQALERLDAAVAELGDFPEALGLRHRLTRRA